MLALSMLALAFQSPALAAEGTGLVLEDIAVRDGVTADVYARVYQHDRAQCSSGALVVVHGATATAASMAPLAEAIAAQDPGGRPMCQIVTIDLPGHGESPAPSGALMGSLSVQDYSAILVGVLEALPDAGIRPVSVAGHSMGGLVVQLAQQRLLDDGSSLHDLGVERAILLSPAIPEALPWGFRDAGTVEGLLAGLTVIDPGLGAIIQIPEPLVPSLFFGRPDGTVASSAPSGAETIALGWTGAESVAAMQSMVGMAPQDPPAIDAGIFAKANGTDLGLVAFEQDNLLPPAELGPLFTYLTGKATSDKAYVVIFGEDAVHGTPQLDPEGMLDAMDGCISLH